MKLRMGTTTTAGCWELRHGRVVVSCPVCGDKSVHSTDKVSAAGWMQVYKCAKRTCDVIGPLRLVSYEELPQRSCA